MEEPCYALLREILRQVHRDLNNETEFKQPSKKYDAAMARESAKRFLDSREFPILCEIIGLRCVERVRQECLS